MLINRRLKRSVAIAAGLIGLAVFATPSVAEPNTITCTFGRSGDGFAGTCEIPCAVNALAVNIDGQRKNFSCNLPNRFVNAALRQQEKFDDWLGTMDGKEPEDPVRFGVVKPKDGKPGVAKTPYGWFALTEAKLDGERLNMTIIANRQLPPTAEDIVIVGRAIELLANTSVWNKEDDRKCPPNPVKWSLFCAMMQATTEVSGGVHYRQPAMQTVREVLNEVGVGRFKLHRIMDYNNHPDTTLAEVHALLKTAQSRLEQKLK
jgi:hypothetical protein